MFSAPGDVTRSQASAKSNCCLFNLLSLQIKRQPPLPVPWPLLSPPPAAGFNGPLGCHGKNTPSPRMPGRGPPQPPLGHRGAESRGWQGQPAFRDRESDSRPARPRRPWKAPLTLPPPCTRAGDDSWALTPGRHPAKVSGIVTRSKPRILQRKWERSSHGHGKTSPEPEPLGSSTDL